MKRFEPYAFLSDLASRWDVLAFIVVIGMIVFLGETSRGLFAPLTQLQSTPLSLDPSHLPEYAARTTFRMFAALVLSLAFTLTYATWAAKSERAGRLLVPILDILQSVPILGFISVTVVFFMSLAPGRVLGAEFAAIFAIFTSQAWNMAFSFYQSLRTIPIELSEAAESFRLSPWMRFWQLEVPFGMPALVWNMMMSMSGGWFFVVASESISVGHTTVALPGVGSYIALAIAQKNLVAIGWAIATMLIVILLYDQLLFRPLVAWVDRFRVESDPGVRVPDSWALTMMRRSRLIQAATVAFHAGVLWTSRAVKRSDAPDPEVSARPKRSLDILWVSLIIAAVVLGLWHIVLVLIKNTPLREALQVAGLATLTMLRVFILIALASLVWVPIGVWVGMRPRAAQVVQPIAQFMAAFPANLLFPIAVFGIVRWKLNPDVWLSPLMILGTQWYILFNVIAGAIAIPSDLKEVSGLFRFSNLQRWTTLILPGIFPYLITGLVTASGGAWNASIIAEYFHLHGQTLSTLGLGAEISRATDHGHFATLLMATIIMALMVVTINRLVWRPLFQLAETKYRLEG
jgi:NitT/TauT family transport system permease protein